MTETGTNVHDAKAIRSAQGGQKLGGSLPPRKQSPPTIPIPTITTPAKPPPFIPNHSRFYTMVDSRILWGGGAGGQERKTEGSETEGEDE